MMEKAREASRRAYAPYSGFRVGAAILGHDGVIYAGCNVENASYGLAICAERNAAAAMALAGVRRMEAVAIASPEASPCFPCGACRQVLREFGCVEVLVERDGKIVSYPFEEILPHAFGPEDLG